MSLSVAPAAGVSCNSKISAADRHCNNDDNNICNWSGDPFTFSTPPHLRNHQGNQGSSVIGGSCKVTLVVAFDFLSQNFERWWGPMDGPLPFYEYRLSGGDTQRRWQHPNHTCCNQICLNFLHSEEGGMLKHLPCAPHAWLCLDPPCGTFTTFN